MNAVAGMRGRQPLIPAKVVFLPMLLALLLIHFILEARIANLYNTTIIATATPLIYLQYDSAAAIRTAATLTLVTVFANIFSRLTENQQRQEADQRERLALLVRATRAGTLEWIASTEETVYSAQLKEMLGHAPDADTSGWRSFLDFVHPDDRPQVETRFRRELNDRSVRSGERRVEKRDYRLRRIDGGVLWINAEAIVLTGPDGSAQRYIASFIDVTDRHRQEEALRTSRDQFETQAQHATCRWRRHACCSSTTTSTTWFS